MNAHAEYLDQSTPLYLWMACVPAGACDLAYSTCLESPQFMRTLNAGPLLELKLERPLQRLQAPSHKTSNDCTRP